MIHVRGTYMYEIENQQPSALKGEGSTTIPEGSTSEMMETEALFSFYCLQDPTTLQVRYIGRTVNPQNRLRNHLYESRKINRTHKQRWINSLSKAPKMRILHVRKCTLNEAIRLEKRLVEWFDKRTYLTNEPDHYLGTINTGNTVYCYALNGTYLTTYVNMHQASIHTGVKDNNIGRACKTSKSAGGFMWSFIKVNNLKPYMKLKSTKSITQYSLEGTRIKTYISAREAYKATNVNYRHISRCALGKQKTAGNYVWKFE